MSNGLHNDPESLLRGAAEHFSATPGEEVWTGIEQAIRQKGRRRRFAWLFILPVLLVPAVIFIGKPFQTKQQTAVSVKENNTGTVANTPPGNAGNDNNNTSPSGKQTPSIPVTVQQQDARNTDAVTNIPPSNENTTPAVKPAVAGNVRETTIMNTNRVRNSNNKTQPAANRAGRHGKEYMPQITTGTIEEAYIEEKPTATAVTPGTTGTIETKTQPAATAIVQNEPEAVKEEPVTPSSKADLPQLIDAAKTNDAPKVNETKNETPKLKPLPTEEDIVKITLPRRNKFRFGFSVSGGAGYRMLQAFGSDKKVLYAGNAALAAGGGGGNGGSQGNISSIKSLRHQPALIASAGGIVNFPLSRKWSIEAGIEYQMLGYNVRAYKTSPVQLNYTSSGYFVTTVSADLNSRYVSSPYYASSGVAGKKTLKNRYHFVNVPVTAMYEVNPQGKRSVYIKAGMGVSYLVGNSAYIYSAESGRYFITPTPEIYRNLNVSAILQPGYLFRLKNDREVRVGLDLQFNMLPTHSKDITLREYLYSTSFKISYLLR